MVTKVVGSKLLLIFEIDSKPYTYHFKVSKKINKVSTFAEEIYKMMTLDGGIRRLVWS